MSFRVPTARMPQLPRRARLLGPVVLGIVLLIIAAAVYVSIYTDLLWFRSVGYSSVFTKRLETQLVLFVVIGVLMALIVGANILIAHRLRPAFRPMSTEQQQLDTLRAALHPVRYWVLGVVLLLIGAIAGASASSHWKTWMLWRNGQHFGIDDPQFHKDVSYFAFTYPFQRWVLGLLFAAVVVSLIAVLLTSYLYGALRPQTPGPKVTPAARAHISVLLGVFVLLKAVAYWLDRYGVNFSKRGFVDTGASYTDVHAVLPAKTILVFVALICALLFFANIVTRNWRVPAIAFGLMVGSAIVIGGVYPLLVQQFSVRPSEADKEAPYIARNIDQTRAAYGLQQEHPNDPVQSTDYSGVVSGSAEQLRNDQSTLPNTRLLDPTVLRDTFDRLQGFKSFYTFPDSLDVDRYDIGGSEKEQLVAVRELDVGGLDPRQQSWINQHLVYTHGFGLAAAGSNAVKSDGTPVFTESDIPPHGELGSTFQPRVYFGENSPDYSIVGAPGAATPRELDFPDNSGTGQQNNTYDGSGGVPVGSTWRQLLYALKFKDKNLLFSGGVNSDSRLLYIRNPRDRVEKVAPFLTLDSDPYPAIVDDRIVWIVDGYTTTDGFPYAARTSLSSAVDDTLTQGRTRKASGQVNYIRNSVKATVDAYDGTVTLYQWGARDPVLETWKSAFPGIIKPTSDMPAELRAHLRYPEDLFKVQRTLLTRYHIDDAHAFYSGNDYWKVPDDPSSLSRPQPAQPPYYLTMALPGQSSPSFQLTTTLLQNNGRNLAAFVSVDSDPSSPTFGVLRVLHLPSSSLVPGPGLVHADFRSFPEASQQISLLDQRGSSVTEGNLLTLPLGNSFIYVEPIYVQSTAATSFPTLRRVLVSWNGAIAYEPTLEQALDVVFGTTTPTPGEQPGAGQGNGQGQGQGKGTRTPAQVRALVTQLQAAQAEADAALRAGDLAGYARAEKKVASLIRQLAAATK